MISCSVTIYPVIKAKPVSYPDLVCQPDAISVDSNNVQTQPLRIRPLNRIAGQVEAMKAYIRVSVKSGDMELGQAESGVPLSEWDYYLPSDKWGEADNVLVTTYEDPRYVTRLAEKQVSILRQHATPFPVEGGWRPLPFKYKNGEYFVDNERNLVFQWMNPVPGNSDVHPFEDIKNNPNTTSWKQHTEWVLLATQVFLANFAKLGSAVFSGDYMFSQHGKDAVGNDSTDYRSPSFTPNFQVDWLKGKVTGKDMDMQGGSVGGFEITGSNLRNKKNRDCWISIECQDGGSKRISSLGNNLPAVIGFSAAGYYEASGPSTNKALILRATGSKRPFGIAGKMENHCIDAIGGVNWKMDGKDHWCMPGVLYAAHFGGGGELYEEWGNGVEIESIGHPSTGTYRITHGIGHMSYFVAITPTQNWTFATLQHKDANSFGFTIADANRGLIDSEFDVMIFGRPFDK